MAKAVALLFLLDSLPGMIGVTCNPTITAPVLEVIGKKLNLTADSIEKLQDIETPYKPNIPSHKFQELSPESLNNIGFVGNSLEISYEYSLEKHTPDLIEHNYIGNATKKEDIDIPDTNNKTGNAKVRFPESAPFLAAIFETVGNVTAQTCGGAVLARNWVLTAASCVNVISPFYSKTSNETTDNYYNVVIGAENPLKDGSIHQVRAIYIHPTPGRRGSKQNWSALLGLGTNSTVPSLALLRIYPEVEEGILQMMEHEIDWDGVNGRLYGWHLKKQESGFVMMATAMPTKQLSSVRCEKAYGIGVTKNTTFCLSVNDSSKNAVKMLAGCPVVVLQDGRPQLLAVSLTDEIQPLLAGGLHDHRDWLRNLMLAGK